MPKMNFVAKGVATVLEGTMLPMERCTSKKSFVAEEPAGSCQELLESAKSC